LIKSIENIIIRPPKTDKDFEKYYQLRWEILRKPWGQPKGSEQTSEESEFYHVMAEWGEDVCGVGCIKILSETTAQVRFMAVSPEFQDQGIGKEILTALEEYAFKNNRTTITLYAREVAIDFYIKTGYKIIGDGYTLFETIHHKVMEKELYKTSP